MINWTLSDKKRRQEIIVGVAYGSDTTKVLEILNNVVSHQPLILKNPPPFIIFIGFGDSSLNFRVLFWTHVDNGLSAKSAVGIAIDMAFRRAGIEIPFPQRDIHIKTTSKEIHVQDIPDQPIRKKAIKQTGRGD
jgi:small-conductance mechanosensitive channel